MISLWVKQMSDKINKHSFLLSLFMEELLIKRVLAAVYN